ncbi:hypothetical protein BHU72_01980 [Desulfuribacillus stibiiarsenatis]|uniref:Haloacid dehalogenase n=1 Tax=Desulfuribacillus stibiiarsenatis TaxID=1390249 RepID=A0A1E5L610_9FIRM|nr:HAD-IB family phosphatase [Desulfuribacillus stibiiarsenatis]OEH85592.1 hypothetical protein BHU72_01980 [Desulfuribacillus stibiiarsenatis]
MKKVAIFDFDGTLYSIETFTFLIQQLKKQKGYRLKYREFNIRFFFPYLAFKLGFMKKSRMRNDALKLFVSLFRNMNEQKIYEFFRVAYKDLKVHVNDAVFREFQLLKEQGYINILVSGAVMPLLHFVKNDIPFDYVVGTEIPMKNGMYDSQQEFLYVQGAVKVEKLQEIISKYESIDWGSSVAFADSLSDLPVLETVAKPTCVKPEPELRDIALARGWRIL